MSEIEHLPVRPNINIRPVPKQSDTNYMYRENTKDLGVSSMSDNMTHYSSKKANVLDFESKPTMEEQTLKENSKNNKKSEPISWVVIALGIIVVILIAIIIYYVLKYNTKILDRDSVIHENAIKPNIQKLLNSVGNRPSVTDNSNTSEHYVEATKDELDSVLTKLEPIKEEPEPPIEQHVITQPTEQPVIAQAVQLSEKQTVQLDQLSYDNPIISLSEDEDNDMMRDTLQDLILNNNSEDEHLDNFDPDTMEKFVEQSDE